MPPQDDRENRLRDFDDGPGRSIESAPYQIYYEDSPSILLASDPAGIIVAANRFGAEYLGFHSDALIGRSILDLVHPDDRGEYLAHLRAALDQPGEIIRIEARKLHGDGGVIWVRDNLRAVGAGADRLVLQSCQDITERRRVEDRQHLLVEAGRVLAASLDYETTLQNVADLAVSSLADWCVIDLCEGSDGNLRRVALAHRDPEMTAIVRSLDEEYPPDRAAREGTLRVVREGSSELMPEIDDSLLVQAARDGRHLQLLRAIGMRSAMVVPLKLRDQALGAITFIGTTPGYKFDAQDLETAELLASRAALAIEKARLFRDAQEASRLRDEVLSVVSHDLRNPLNTITLSSGFLREVTPIENKVVRKQLEIIQRAADQMERLIQDLLDVAQIESGRLPVRIELEDVGSLIAEACHSFRPLAEGKRVHLGCEVSETLGAIPVDRNRLIQVFSNLIGNAVKFSREGGRIVVSAQEDEGWVRFTVKDNGVGIDPHDLPHLFDRFYQSQKTKRGGAGLGLAIVKGIVDAHGGRIHVESQVGEGSLFTFELPHSTS